MHADAFDLQKDTRELHKALVAEMHAMQMSNVRAIREVSCKRSKRSQTGPRIPIQPGKSLDIKADIPFRGI